MSASLVGSEMCIRDRLRPGWSAGRYGPPPGGQLAHSPAFLRARPRGQPVSYTHLTLPTICSV
eukprot:14051004-Alexandrium_andersonii.AAC.1